MEKILEVLKLIERNGYEAYIVGGFVRDRLLGIQSYDVDICTSAKPEELKKIIPEIIYKDLFCSYFKLDEYNIEITTYRIEENYNGRRPEKVDYALTLKDDLKRRDFTINTICMDSNENIIDYYNGITDLNNRIIKCVENTETKLNEDYLRILRAIRFSIVLNFDLDKELEEEIIKNKEKIKLISSYRKRQELDKIIKIYNISLIKKLNIEEELGIFFPDNIKKSDDIIELYSQCEIKIDNFFTKEELLKYQLLHNKA